MGGGGPEAWTMDPTIKRVCGALLAPSAGSGAEPHPLTHFEHLTSNRAHFKPLKRIFNKQYNKQIIQKTCYFKLNKQI